MDTQLAAGFPQDNFKDNTVQDILKSSHDMQSPVQLLHVSQITENLFLTCAASVNPDLIKAYNFTCIINAADELTLFPVEDSRVEYYKVPVLDYPTSNIAPYFDPIADVIFKHTKEGHRALLFCVAGVSRSATLCIAYLMKYYSAALLDAYNYVKARRPRIRPNIGFFQQLIDYERKLRGTTSVFMVYNDMLQMKIPHVYESDYRMVNAYRRRGRV